MLKNRTHCLVLIALTPIFSTGATGCSGLEVKQLQYCLENALGQLAGDQSSGISDHSQEVNGHQLSLNDGLNLLKTGMSGSGHYRDELLAKWLYSGERWF